MTRNGISVHHVMCPTDFSEFAERAFAEAIRLARWFGARVTVLHVFPPPIPMGPDMSSLPFTAEITEGVRNANLNELRRFVETAGHGGVPIELVCREGDARREIQDAARETNVDLVVMGTHGRTGLARVALGSVTEAILAHPPAPVLVVRKRAAPHDGLFRKMLCAVDLSEWSAETMAFALAVAQEGTKHVTVLNVIDDSDATHARAALARLRKLIPEHADDSGPIEARVGFGVVEREIVRIAEQNGADVIVIGTHGRGAIDRILFGSTPRDVVRTAGCPVLVVPSGHAWPATSVVRHQSQAVARAPKVAITS